MKRRLIVSDGQRERELLLVGTIVVGRDPACDISEDGDSLLSRRHSEFVAGPEGVIVRDLGSRNGTFVNGVRVAEGPVHPGDVVHIGHLRLRYVEGDAPAAAAAPSPAIRGGSAATSLPEDDEVTRILPGVGPPARGRSTVVGIRDEDERTIITPAPGAAAETPRPSRGTLPADDEPTVLIPSGGGIHAPGARTAQDTPIVSAAAQPAAPGPAPRDLRTFVLGQVLGVVAITLAALAAGLVLGRGELLAEGTGAGAVLKWLALPVAVAVLAAYRAAGVISRRIAPTPAADNEEGRGV